MPEYGIVLEVQSVDTDQIMFCHGNVDCTSAISTASRLGRICADRTTYEVAGGLVVVGPVTEPLTMEQMPDVRRTVGNVAYSIGMYLCFIAAPTRTLRPGYELGYE